MIVPPTARAADRDQGHGRESAVVASADDSAVTRFSYLPINGETPLILTSTFGRYRVTLPGDHTPRRVTSRIAFSCHPVQPGDAADPDRPVEQIGEFWVCRITFAVDSRNGRPHRLIWGLNYKGTLVTIAKPEVRAPEQDRAWPSLIPVDAVTFARLNLPLNFRPAATGAGC